MLVAAGGLRLILTSRTAQVGVASIAFEVISEKHCIVVISGFIQQLMVKTVVDDCRVDAASAQILSNGAVVKSWGRGLKGRVTGWLISPRMALALLRESRGGICMARVFNTPQMRLNAALIAAHTDFGWGRAC